MNLAIKSDGRASVLVVDDDAGLREQIIRYLTDHGFRVQAARDAREMDQVLASEMVDLVILDLVLPDEDGLSICQRLKASSGTSVLMLSAIGEDVDRIVGLELGADDYLAKPCVPRELLARVRAILRIRQTAPSALEPTMRCYAFAGCRLDPFSQQLQAPNGLTVFLTPGEYALLRAFVERPKRVLTREDLLDSAHGEDADVFDRSIDVRMHRLRRKLRETTDRDVIVTYRGAGYMLDVAVTRL